MAQSVWTRGLNTGAQAVRRPESGRLARTALWKPSQPVRRRINAAAASEVTPRSLQDAPHPSPSSSRSSSPRLDALKRARPFSDFLTDTFNRQHDYLRISVTERCNLRCLYCMPEEGVPLSPNRELLTTPEIVLLSSVFVSQGVSKIRLTGGEPTVRRDIVPLMHQIGALRPHGLRELCLTTNGLSLHRKLDSMVEAGLTGINLSLDTLDPWQFQIMTRRKGFDAVKKSVDKIFELNRLGAGIKFKINCVVMRGQNDHQILPFVDMTRDQDVEVRFIEYMPFDGNKWNQRKMMSYAEMLDVIRERYPTVQKVQDHKNDTSKTWQVPGFAGRLGFITSMTHNFCGTCNRLRITSDGSIKVCLFGNEEVSLRDILRKSNDGEPIDEQAYEAMKQIEMNRRQGLAGSERPLGTAPNEAELLDVIGTAVKRKKEKHAGLGELEHLQNRPMILIDPMPPSMIPAPDPTIPGDAISPASRSWLPWSAHARPGALLLPNRAFALDQTRLFSAAPRRLRSGDEDSEPGHLTHVSPSGSARMVSISDKQPTSRLAKAVCTVTFSNDTALQLIRDNQMKKGDVLGVARIAGIMAAKRTSELVPLCHPIALSHVGVELEPVSSNTGDSGAGTQNAEGEHYIRVVATVTCDGKTGVEMEALTAASTAALTVYDMCKAVDKGMVIGDLRVVLKEGGKSGRWEMP